MSDPSEETASVAGWLDMSRYPNVDPDQAVAAPELAALRDVLRAAPAPPPPDGVWAALLDHAVDPAWRPSPGAARDEVNDHDDHRGHPAPVRDDLAHQHPAHEDPVTGPEVSRPAGASGHDLGPGQHPEPWPDQHPGRPPGGQPDHGDHPADHPHQEGGHWL